MGAVESPETRYAWNARVALAYQVIGEGPIDLLYLQGRCSHPSTSLRGYADWPGRQRFWHPRR
jgi:hypothetical protein